MIPIGLGKDPSFPSRQVGCGRGLTAPIFWRGMPQPGDERRDDDICNLVLPITPMPLSILSTSATMAGLSGAVPGNVHDVTYDFSIVFQHALTRPGQTTHAGAARVPPPGLDSAKRHRCRPEHPSPAGFRLGSWKWLLRLLPALLIVGVPAARGQIYVGSATSDSAVVLSNFPSAATPKLLLSAPDEFQSAALRRPDGMRLDSRKNSPPAEWLEIIRSVAMEKMISPRLIHAVISAESNYDPAAVSSRGAIGLMQVLPSTARRFGIDDPRSPRANVVAGASYLKFLMNLFDSDIELTLAAYNAGETAVFKAGRKVPDFPETQAYVRRVMANLTASGNFPL